MRKEGDIPPAGHRPGRPDDRGLAGVALPGNFEWSAIPEDGPMATTYQAAHLEKDLNRATKRLSQPSKRRHARRLPLPSDECAALHYRRDAQENEWRDILRKQKRAQRLAAEDSEDGTSQVTSATGTSGYSRSQVTAGLKTDDILARQEQTGVLKYGHTTLLMSRGDALPRGPPLPGTHDEERQARKNRPTLEQGEFEATAPDALDRLSRLVQVGSRP